MKKLTHEQIIDEKYRIFKLIKNNNGILKCGVCQYYYYCFKGDAIACEYKLDDTTPPLLPTHAEGYAFEERDRIDEQNRIAHILGLPPIDEKLDMNSICARAEKERQEVNELRDSIIPKEVRQEFFSVLTSLPKEEFEKFYPPPAPKTVPSDSPHIDDPDGTPAKGRDEKLDEVVTELKTIAKHTAVLPEIKERIPPQKSSPAASPPITPEPNTAPESATLRPRPKKALSELIETKSFISKITPLPKYDSPNSKWITSQKAAQNLGISEGRLSNLRVKNECVNYKEEKYAGFIIGRSNNGLIWCKSGEHSNSIFYLFSEVKRRVPHKAKK